MRRAVTPEQHRGSARDHAVRRTRDLIRAATRANAYGGRLPHEDALMLEYGASRSTVREALASLRDEGLVDRVQGIGTVVLTEALETSITEAHGVDDDQPDCQTMLPRLTALVLDHGPATLSPVVARALQVEPGARGWRIDYVALLDGEPLALATNYLRYPQAEAVANRRLKGDWYSYLNDCGLTTGESTFLIGASIADERDTELLGVRAGDALIILEQVISDLAGQAFDYAIIRSRADRIGYFSRATRATIRQA